MSADAELAAAHADDDLVLVDMRCRGHGGADLRVSVLGLPDLLAALGVQRDQMAVELAQEDFAVSEGEPTVDVVAAGDGLDTRVLLGKICPLDLADVRPLQLQGVDVVWERRVHVHRVPDHERRALMTAQRPGRERPCRPQVLHVRRRDLTERAEPGLRVILSGHDPLLVVGLKLEKLLASIRAHSEHENEETCNPDSRPHRWTPFDSDVFGSVFLLVGVDLCVHLDFDENGRFPGHLIITSLGWASLESVSRDCSDLESAGQGDSKRKFCAARRSLPQFHSATRRLRIAKGGF